MVDTLNSRGKIFLASCIVIILLSGMIVGAVYSFITANNANVQPEPMDPELDLNPAPEPVEPLGADESTRGKAGTLKWSIQLADEELSAPAICDLNPPIGGGDVFYEVVVASAADAVYAVDHKGNKYWKDPFTDAVIDNAHILASGLDFDPAPFFSSVTPVDISGGKGAEILVGAENGVVCIKTEGQVAKALWTDKGLTDGYYFSSIAVCDLEGDYAGLDADGNDVGYRDDLEIVLGSDNRQNADAFLECWQANSNEVFRYEVDLSFEHAFFAASVVATEMDGYFLMEDGPPDWVKDDNPETLYSDFLTSTHAYPGRIWSHQDGQAWNQYHEKAACSPGHWAGHETYATPVVGNFTGGPEVEAIIGHGSGAMSWQSSDGTVRMYRQDGSEVATPYTTGSAPSSVFSSPAGCDAQNLDEDDLGEDEFIEYEVYFGCDNGMVYCLSATDLSELWSYQTGGRILSSPAICNIDSDDSLEVVIGSNDGKVYCFEADPQELDTDGNPNPKDDGIEDGGGDSGTYDVLWIYDTTEVTGASGEIGISSPVVGDIDRDGQLDVLIGDTGGTLYCINAGGGCVPGQVDWPMFHGDLNKTGLYNPGTSYGVRLDRGKMELDGQVGPEKLQKSVKPGHTVSYNLTITNIGASKTFTDVDTFWLEVNQLVYKFGDLQEDHEWLTPELMGGDLKWGMNEGELQPYVMLASMQKTNLTLNQTAPWTGDLSEICRVEIKAQSVNDSFARDNIVCESSLEVTLDFDIEILREPVKDKDDELFGQKVIKINPSDKATVDVFLRNKGNLNDSYDFRIEGVLWGWEAYFVNSDSPVYTDALQLDAPIMESQFPGKFKGSEGIVRFTIEAPADAQESEILTLKIMGTSAYSIESDYLENITKYDYLIVEVNPVPDLELKCRHPRQYVNPGENVSFKVEVINRGNSKIQVKLEHSQIEEGWELVFMTENNLPFIGDPIIEVMNEGVTNVLVYLKSPHNAEAGSRQDVIIKGATTGDASLVSSDSVALTAIVMQTFDVNVTVTPKNIKVDPGTTIVYNITIKNEGNGKDFVIITPTVLEVNWDSTFYLDDEERVTSELALNETVVFNMQIRIPKNQLAGTYKVGINVSSIGDREEIEFETEINKVFNLSVYGVEHSELTSDKVLNDTIQPMPGVSPGSVLSFVVEIMNGGNAPDWITVTLDPLKPSYTRESGYSIADWSEFEDLGWEAYFIGITNTEAYLTDIEDLDFAEDIDISHEKGLVGYLNDGNTTVRELSIRLGVSQRIWLKIQVKVPRDIPDVDQDLHPDKDAPWQFLVECTSADTQGKNMDVNLGDNKVKINLNILLPDLALTGRIEHQDYIDNGEIVTISIVVKNIGDIEARSVIVTFYVNGEEIKSQTINVLKNGDARLIPFTWQATSGQQKLKIKVDPEDAIVELDETNNKKEKTVQVGETGAFGGNPTQGRQFWAILPIIIVIIILAIIIVILKKRKR